MGSVDMSPLWLQSPVEDVIRERHLQQPRRLSRRHSKHWASDTLAAPVADQKPEPAGPFVEVHDEVTGLLDHPGSAADQVPSRGAS